MVCVRTALRAVLALGFFAALPLHAFAPVATTSSTQSVHPRPSLQANADALDVTPSLILDARGDSLLATRVSAFKRRVGGTWDVRWDTRGDRPNVVQGSGVPVIAGKGNALQAAQFGASSPAQIGLDAVANAARAFVDAQNDLLQLDGIDLRLDRERSVPYGKERAFWSIEFAQYRNDVRVDGAFVYVRIAQGNVVQFGAERVAPVTIDTQPALTREQAFYLAWHELDFPADARIAQTIEAGELGLYPSAPAGEASATEFTGARGFGYAHVLAWRFVFRVEGAPETWQVLFDAQADRVIDVRDLNDFVDATVSGGIYPTTNTDVETVVPFPFASVTNGTAKVTDTLGIYDYSGGSATTTLGGKYFRMVDTCGSISLANSTDGNLAFGSGAGTDCTTPTGNTAGSGNTHASRSGFYHLTRINEKARGILPGNTWLQGRVNANMNINQQCNAYWDGSELNFFKSGGGCSNTGEIAAVFLHEWGHGLDTNTGGAASENGSGEAVGDTFAFLETRDACIGQNFRPGANCHNCTACTGVRDVGDFSTHGTSTIATPANVTSNTGIDCDAYVGLGGVACPYRRPDNGQAYQGPMGYEGHCESVIASSANWDLTQALIERYGAEEGWHHMDDIWYGSLTPSKSAYRVQSGGTCNPSATVNGCGATNWYTVYLAADDDDGNLANGTPNACRIWDAMNAHGIACGERPVCSADTADFTLTIANDTQSMCAPGSSSFQVAVGAESGFAAQVTLAASGQPAGAGVTFAPNPVAPGQASTMTVDAAAGTLAGTYTITVNGSATGSPGHSADTHLTIGTGTPSLTAPADNAINVSLSATFSWQAATAATAYTIEVANDATFATIVAGQSGLTTTSWAASGLTAGTHYFWRVRATGACGDGQNSGTFQFTTAGVAPTLHTVGGNVGGLAGSGLLLALNGGAPLPIVADGTFAFPTPLLTGTSYTVTVAGQPTLPTQTCAVANGTGVIADVDVSNVQITCTTNAYSVGGTVSGLAGTGFELSLNGGAPLAVSANGGFTFPTDVASGATYTVTVATAPGSPAQTCAIDHGNGTVVAANVTDVAVTCTTNSYTVGGDVDGLVGSGLALSLNGGPDLAVGADGPFTFPAALTDGATYAVTITRQPHDPAQACLLSHASGAIVSANIADVVVSCGDRIFANGFELP